ncbi:MAG: ion transporter [Ignavibacteria bacterium]|nr:ion transporter [Ignavibacteria bacterium]
MDISKVQEFAQKISNNNCFRISIAVVIILGGVLAGISTCRELYERFHIFFIWFDWIVTGIFILEMLIYMLEHGYRIWRYFFDPWHIFDFIVIFLSLMALVYFGGSSEFVIVLRLARILRLLRIFEKLKKFKTILDILFRIIPSIVNVLILLCILLYIYGVVTTDLFGKYSPEKFGTLFTSLETLYFIMFDTWAELYSDPGIKQLIQSGFPEILFFLIFISFQFFAALILLNFFVGLITSDLEAVREIEKRGKTKVSNKHHSLILGWNDKIYSIVDELIEANLTRDRATIVILSNKDKSDMDYELEHRFSGFSTTKIIAVSGSISNVKDLELVNAWEAKSIVILNEGNDRNADYSVLKSVLALLGKSQQIDSSRFHIVAEIYSDEVKKKIQDIDRNNRVVFFNPEQFIVRLIAQAVLNPNISNTYYEILGFKGNELYITKLPPNLVGVQFADAIYHYNNATLVGIIRNEKCELNPSKTTVLRKEDLLVLLAENDKSLKECRDIRRKVSIDYEQISSAMLSDYRKRHNVLILGYSPKIPEILWYLNSYFTSTNSNGNLVRILLFDKMEKKEIREAINEKFKNNSILKLHIEYGKEKKLEDVVEDIETVIILANDTRFDTVNEIDTNTLYLISILNRLESRKEYKFSIVAEFLDINNSKIASNGIITDYIIGSNIVGPVLAQLSEQKELIKVFDHLFVSEGSEIYVRDVECFVRIGEKVSFATIVEAAMRKDETAIGIIQNYKTPQAKFILNPKKTEYFKLGAEDRIIVLAKEI